MLAKPAHGLSPQGRREKMPLLLLSFILSMVCGALLWLVIGSRLPPGAKEKLPAMNNIAYYSLALLVPIFLIIFFVF